jgi:hypothetical protein
MIEVQDHKTFGKDKLLADGTIEVIPHVFILYRDLFLLQIWKHVQSVGNTIADVWAELRDGQGLLHLRLEFDRGAAIGRGASSASLELNRGSTSPSSPSRFLTLKKRNGEE